MTYAANTKVSVEKSRAEIETTLARYGCRDFGYRTSDGFAQIAFKMNGRMLRFDLKLPNRDERRFTHSHAGRRERPPERAYSAWDQGCRASWRALALVIKAKLEAVESGITTFEVEFMAHTIVPGGRVFHEVALPQIAEAYETGRMPPLLGVG